MPTSRILDLPEDVGAHLVETLEYDLDSLKALSLVSHAMRSTVAPVLYKDLMLVTSDYACLDQSQPCSDSLRLFTRRLRIYCNSGTYSNIASKLFVFISSLGSLSELIYFDQPLKPFWSLIVLQEVLRAVNQGCPQLSRLSISFGERSPALAPGPFFTGWASLEGLKGVPNLQALALTWTLDDSLFQDASKGQLAILMTTSSETLRELELTIDVNYGVKPDLRWLKSATRLDVLRIRSTLHDPDIVATIADTVPWLQRLDLQLKHGNHYTTPRAAAPFVSDPFYQPLAKLHRLHTLNLNLSFEAPSGDLMPVGDAYDNASLYAWFIRCIHPRRAATQDLARVCMQLQYCNWHVRATHWGVVHNATIRFRIVEQCASGSAGEPGILSADGGFRRVQTYREAYMDPGVHDLPPDLID
ncbi:hypothetical protein HGRIS_008670 [Hohenbuehelia grisea]|uniref:F-box domain-containing protein n=1 Tax=Hohenbuehelia grisea TaxID=104357 RepID=A0ABR3J8L6_9AGAR